MSDAARSTVVELRVGAARVPGTLVLPCTTPAPAVVLLHGTMSHRDEVGGMFERLAQVLGAAGIASLRIDFRGCGASQEPQTDFTIESELADARATLDALAAHPEVLSGALGVLGFSQGGLVATLLAARDPRVRALVTWSAGDFSLTSIPRFDALRAEARTHGSATLSEPWARFTFSSAWFEQAAAARPARAIAAYAGALLTVNCAGDTTVAPGAGAALAAASGGTDRTVTLLPGGDHVFGALDGDPLADRVLTETAAWLATRLADATRAQ